MKVFRIAAVMALLTAPSDPWGNVRSVDTPKASAPVKSRTKTGSTAN